MPAFLQERQDSAASLRISYEIFYTPRFVRSISEIAAAEFFFGKTEVVADFVYNRFGDLLFHIFPLRKSSFKTALVELNAGRFHLNAEHGALVVGYAYKNAEYQITFVLVPKCIGHFFSGQYLYVFSL